MKNEALFIVFEGIDGSGTSTQSELLQKYFLSQNKKAVLSSEPSSGPIGNLIRECFKKRISLVDDKKLFDEQIAYLFVADRHDHLYNNIDGVFTLKQKGITSICTRYFFSSLAYNCSNKEEADFIKQLNSKFPMPDLTIYIDNPIKVSLERIKNRAFKDVYENKNKLIQVKSNYDKIFSQDFTKNVLIVKGDNSPEEVHNTIVKYINENY